MKNCIIAVLAAGLMAAAGCSCGSTKSVVKLGTGEDNAVIEAIMARRSIRQYKDTPVEREKLQLIAECGVNAPNGMNAQAWEVRIVDSKEWIDGMTEVYKAANPQMASRPGFKNMFVNAPAVIAVAAPDDTYNGVNAGLLGENIMLAAQSLGLGTCCLGAPTRYLNSASEAAPFREKLGVNPDYQILYMIAVGYPDEEPAAKPRDLSKIRFLGD
ncbi:MAG: nitroreductase family protein [Bacteroidales bacterium]|nr:nitroreductase family protein [Bacteroidales bacterium]MBR4817506.1 nitroreductase family protein [Bacteroidales bacterium]